LHATAAYLSDSHFAEVVEESGVDPRLLEGRYRTVTAEEVRALDCFSECQARDGLLIALYSPAGKVYYTLKPDKPRTVVKKKSKRVPKKYETQNDSTLKVVDVHPSLRQRLLFSDEPMYVTEGAKKADCLVSRNRLAVDLSGAGRSRHIPPELRPELFPDWDEVPLAGRKVYIAFDADFRKRVKVALTIVRLAERLTKRGAHVYIIWLPGPENGIDDFVVAGGDLERLEKDATLYQAHHFAPYLAKYTEGYRRASTATERRFKRRFRRHFRRHLRQHLVNLATQLRAFVSRCRARSFYKAR
jgi:hypothetical protein